MVLKQYHYPFVWQELGTGVWASFHLDSHPITGITVSSATVVQCRLLMVDPDIMDDWLRVFVARFRWLCIDFNASRDAVGCIMFPLIVGAIKVALISEISYI